MNKFNDLDTNYHVEISFIEQIEKEMGCRFDDEREDNPTMIALFGAIANKMNTDRRFSDRDNYVLGVVSRHQLTPEYKEEQRSKEMMAQLLLNGLSPDALLNINSLLN